MPESTRRSHAGSGAWRGSLKATRSAPFAIVAAVALLAIPVGLLLQPAIHVAAAVVALVAGGLAVRRLVRELAQREGEAAEQLAELRGSESRMRDILDLAPEAFVEFDAEGLVTDWNPQAASLFGWTREEALGRPFTELLLPEEERETHEEARRRFVARGSGWIAGRRVELLAQARSGRRFPMELSLTASECPRRGWTFRAFLHDISARRRSEDALREAEERFRKAFDDATIGMSITSLQGRFERVNGALCEMLGRPEHELIGAAYAEVTHPDDQLADAASAEAMLAGRRSSFQAEKRYLRPDGSVVWVALSTSLVRDGSGEPLYFVSQMEDITERRAAAERLAEAEERFRLAFDGAPVGMAVADPDGRLLRVNRALSDITGYSEAELLAGGMDLLQDPSDRDAEAEQVRRLLAGEARTYKVERRLEHAAGHEVWVCATISLARDGDGAPRYLVRQIEDISERKRFEGQLAYLADHDPLTGLLNRRAFHRELEKQLAYARRYRHEGAVVVLDLDSFKDINDTLGHASGDELISRVAGVLGERLRETDMLGRLGGDEFAIVLPETSREEAALVAGTLIESIRTLAIAVEGERPLRASASAGIATFSPDTDLTAEELLVNADIAMYDAKDAGRDRVFVSEDTQVRQAQMRARLKWSQRIREALVDDRFLLYQQPVVDLATGEVASYELLLRMLGDGGEIIPPGAFLPVAERCGLVTEIDRWVVRSAIRTLARETRPGRRLRFSVNLSGASMTDPELEDFIASELKSTGADPSGLIFEVTETAAIVNVERARRFAARLNELGCELALDDFGAGFGSFYYLKHLPFDYLKIDGDFIRSLPESREDQLVVKAIVEIANGMGKRTVAEFVSDERTVRMLTRLGVDHAQGYHVGRPAPLADVLAQDLPRPAPLSPRAPLVIPEAVE